ncbi:MAG: hypothetical protein ACON34_02525 [Flavobacteriales bacterium]
MYGGCYVDHPRQGQPQSRRFLPPTYRVNQRANNRPTCAGHCRCRFESKDLGTAEIADISSIFSKAVQIGVDVINTENLYTLDGVRATPSAKPVGGRTTDIETLSRMRGRFFVLNRGSEK